MPEMQQSRSGRSRSRERGSAHLKKQAVVSSDISQNCYAVSPELSRSSSKKSSGVPIKSLIEEELNMKEKKVRHPSPGVIARLMGLDTLPPSPPLKPYPDPRKPHYHKKKTEASPETRNHVPSVSDERYVFTEDELPEFKDVFEITEARKAKKKLHSSPVHSKNSSPEIEFVQQKFADAKRLSTEESLRSSREFNDAIEALESNRDALLEFLSEPNSLFAKQLKDLAFLPSSPPRSASQITILKPSCKRHPGVNLEKGRDLEKDGNSHCRKYVSDFSSHSHEDDFVSLTFDKPIKSNFKRVENSTEPTNIVVLKPSLAKAQRTVGAGTFPVFYPEDGAESRFTKSEDCFVGTRAKSSREIARQVTRQMRRAVSMKPVFMPDSDPLYEFNPLFDDRSYYASPKLYQVESSVSKEARKRLSDRWKTTHMTGDVGLHGGGGSNTLGEMLELSDMMTSEKSRRDRCILGISSNDGWKDGNFRNLPRSKSLPSSSHARMGHRSGHRRRGSRASEFGMLKDVLNVGPVKGLRGEKTRIGDFSEGEESVLTEREIHVNSEELKSKGVEEVKIEEVVPIEDATFRETIPFDSTPTPVVQQMETGIVLEAVTKDEIIVSPTLADVADKQEVMEHPVCSTEGEEQPSPNSTLDSPFEEVAEEEEETSTSGCFEKISADLQELRMQLNLLKMGGSIGEQQDLFLLSDEEDDNTLPTNSHQLGDRDHHFRDEDERDFSYLFDMLINIGGHASIQDELLSSCYTLDCPVEPAVFTRLEKKYGDLVLWPRSERKMLFDLINSILSEIICSWVEVDKWFSTVRPKWDRDRFVEEVWGKVVKRRRDIECGGEEIFLEARWLGLVENGVGLIEGEIESILHEDLLHELVMELVYCH